MGGGFFKRLCPCLSRDSKSEGRSDVSKFPTFGAAAVVHADISAEDGARKIADEINADPFEYLSGPSKQRVVVSVNFWRNLRAEQSIKNHHLAMVDAQTIDEHELLATKMKNYAIGGQEQYMMHNVNEKHQLVYFPDMTQSEILVFKQGAYIMEIGVGPAKYCVVPARDQHKNHILHTSIENPNAPVDALPRRSVVCAGVKVYMKEIDAMLN